MKNKCAGVSLLGLVLILFLGLAFIVFLGLKLGELGVVAAWSWWSVTAPLWIPAVIAVAIVLVPMIAYVMKKVWAR